MNTDKALEIIRALADGVDPYTGRAECSFSLSLSHALSLIRSYLYIASEARGEES